MSNDVRPPAWTRANDGSWDEVRLPPNYQGQIFLDYCARKGYVVGEKPAPGAPPATIYREDSLPPRRIGTPGICTYKQPGRMERILLQSERRWDEHLKRTGSGARKERRPRRRKRMVEQRAD